jgi:hypothetical protein
VIKALYFSVNFSLFEENAMDKKLLICNVGFLVTGAVVSHPVSSWAQDAGSEPPARWAIDSRALSTLPKHEISCGSCLRRRLDPMQSDPEIKSGPLHTRSQKNLNTRTAEARSR